MRGAAAHEIRRDLLGIYTRSLKRYVMPGGILVRSLQRTEDGWQLTEPCALNTSEALKAVFLMDRAGIQHGLDPHALLDRLVADYLATADHQVASLALWAAATGRSPHADRLWQTVVERAPRDVFQSMQMAWTLAAVCAYAESHAVTGAVSSFAEQIVARILANQNPKTGLFHPSAAREGLLRRRRADTTLSSQTYPIYALTQYARVFGARDMLEPARRCAERLCLLQGDSGQWWWRYDARRGAVLQRYPVYAVNQDGAVPLAFGALQAALGDRRYDEAIDRGLVWEGGENELRRSLLDAQAGFVARSLEPEDGSYRLSWEMYAYQPARALTALLSDPAWSAQALA
jgi:hypothetical protein